MDPSIRHHLNVGREYYQQGDYLQAEAHLRAVLEAHDGFADVHNMLGVIHYHSGRPGKARECFERALAINPRYTEAALNLAVCYNELGRYQDGKAIYTRAAAGQDAHPGSLEQLDPFIRGKLANLHAEVGSAYVAVGLLERATEEFRKALDLCPTFVDLRTKLATTLRDTGRLDEALDELTAIFELSPDYLPARVHLGLTLWRAGRVQEARAHWQYVLEREPDNRSCRVYLSMTEP